eukprot:2763889-Rhodomonas_salina.4
MLLPGARSSTAPGQSTVFLRAFCGTDVGCASTDIRTVRVRGYSMRDIPVPERGHGRALRLGPGAPQAPGPGLV